MIIHTILLTQNKVFCSLLNAVDPWNYLLLFLQLSDPTVHNMQLQLKCDTYAHAEAMRDTVHMHDFVIYTQLHVLWITFMYRPTQVSTNYMWPDLQKPNIMAHTKIFSIKHYKNLVRKIHLIKNLKWTYKGHNLAILTRISKN